MTQLLYTGGSGRMASVIRRGLEGRYDRVVLYSRSPIDDTFSGEENIIGQLADLPRLTDAMRGVDVVLHFAGIADEAPFVDILDSNIAGTHYVFEAARRAGVRRVIYASSHHIIGCYPAGEVVGVDEPVRPDSFYGLSKVFGEGAARLYHDKWGLEAVCLRIGAFRPEPEDVRHLSVWLSHRDGIELIRCAIEASPVGFATVYGVSANTRSWWDNTSAAAEIGYRPRDDADQYAAQLDLGTAPIRHGGQFAAPDYRGGTW